MQTKNLYIKAELDGSFTRSPNREDGTWALSEYKRIIAERGLMLFHNGKCYGASIADTKDTEGWTEGPAETND